MSGNIVIERQKRKSTSIRSVRMMRVAIARSRIHVKAALVGRTVAAAAMAALIRIALIARRVMRPYRSMRATRRMVITAGPRASLTDANSESVSNSDDIAFMFYFVNLDFLMVSPVAPGESIIHCVLDGGAYELTAHTFLTIL
jgi:hypothetical protein